MSECKTQSLEEEAAKSEYAEATWAEGTMPDTLCEVAMQNCAPAMQAQLREAAAYVARLEAIALDADAYRCEGCQGVFGSDDVEHGYDCTLCKKCAAELREAGHRAIECDRCGEIYAKSLGHDCWMLHELKCKQPYFDDVVQGRKPFELRKNDRSFSTGHTLFLREVDITGEHYTGKTHYSRVTYLIERFEGLAPGYCILGLGEAQRPEPQETEASGITREGWDTLRDDPEVREIIAEAGTSAELLTDAITDESIRAAMVAIKKQGPCLICGIEGEYAAHRLIDAEMGPFGSGETLDAVLAWMHERGEITKAQMLSKWIALSVLRMQHEAKLTSDAEGGVTITDEMVKRGVAAYGPAWAASICGHTKTYCREAMRAALEAALNG